MVKQSRLTAIAVLKGFESDCSVDFHYFSSDDDLSDFTDHQATLRHLPPPYPQDGSKARQSKKATDRSPKGNSERGGGEVKSTPKNRKPLFTDSVDEPVKRPDGLRSSRYTEGNLDAMFGRCIQVAQKTKTSLSSIIILSIIRRNMIEKSGTKRNIYNLDNLRPYLILRQRKITIRDCD